MALLEDTIDNQVSYGSNGYLDGFSNRDNLKHRWNVFLINTLTLSRNVLGFIQENRLSGGAIGTDAIQKLLNRDIEMITIYIKKYIDSVVNFTSAPGSNYKVIFYFPDYEVLRSLNPATYKEPTKTMANSLWLYNKIYNVAKNQNAGYNKLIKKDNLVSYTFLKPEMYSSISLFRAILNELKFSKRPLLITHIPNDYFLGKFIPNLSYMDSFTGRVLSTKQDISEKLFKSSSIPFSKYILYLFGDKYLIKSHLPRGMKSKLTLIASTEKWNLLSDDQLKSLLIKKELIDNNNYNFHPY